MILHSAELQKRFDMQSFVARFGLPLLTRELIQKSTHTRTYVIRVIYAVVLYATALYQYRRWTGQLPDSFAALGEGLPLFELLVDWQYAAIYLFLPLMTCGTITVEKERQTLMLLKLTKLSGWTILIEKLASRLLEFGIFLMLSFPLGAVAYGLGGVEVSDLVNAAYNVAVMAVVVGCFSLFMSTWFRTTAGAMIGVYLLGVAIKFGGPPLIRPIVLGALRLGLMLLSWLGLETDGQTAYADTVHQYLDTHGIPTTSSQGFFDASESDIDVDFGKGWLSPVPPTVPASRTWTVTAIASIPQFVLALFFLVLARICLWRRAESRPSQFLRNCFVALDSWFKAINRNRITGGITFGKQGADLPTREPISWYETRRRLVGRTPYLVRVLLAIEVPLIVWFAWCASVSPMLLAGRLQIAWEWGWMLAVLVIVAISTGVVAVERSRQTLDVLLTTPLTPTEIVTQKMAGVWRWVFVMSVPLFTVLLLQVAGRTWFSTDYQSPLTEYLLNYVDEGHASLSGLVFHGNLVILVLRRSAAILVYLPLVAWLGFQFGMRLKNQWRAILVLCLSLAILCNVSTILNPFSAMRSPLEQAEVYYGLTAWLKWLDPRYVIAGNAVNDYLQTDLLLDSDILPLEWFPFLFHFLIVGGMLWSVRRNAFRSFSRFVWRLEPATGRPVRITPAESTPVFAAIQFPEGPGEVQLFDAEPTTSSPRTKND